MVDHVASFVGFGPVSRPALVVLVSLDTPRVDANQGGDIAAPLFARVAEQALRHLAIPPDDSSRVIRMVPWNPQQPTRIAHESPAALPPPSAAPGRMPDLRGRSAREAAIAAARRGLIVELSGSGRVVEQVPAPGVEIASGASCRLVLSPDPAPTPPDPPAERSAELS
jgi:cell division protein FtsI (penicillin-binding protein 3)